MVETGDDYNELKGVQISGTAEIFDDPRPHVRGMGSRVRAPRRALQRRQRTAAVESMLNKRVVIKVNPIKVASWDHPKL